MSQDVASVRNVRKKANAFVDVDIDTLESTLEKCLSNDVIAKMTKSSPASICRWQDYGCQTPDGRTHRLKFMRIGRRRYTRREDLAAFLEALNA
jgi:hypothetical protein